MINLQERVAVFNKKTNKTQRLKITNPKIGLNGITGKWEYLSDLRDKMFINYFKEFNKTLENDNVIISHWKKDSSSKVKVLYNHKIGNVNFLKDKLNLLQIELKSLKNKDEKYILKYYVKEFIQFVRTKGVIGDHSYNILTKHYSTDFEKALSGVVLKTEKKDDQEVKVKLPLKDLFKEFIQNASYINSFNIRKEKFKNEIDEVEKILSEIDENALFYEGYIEDPIEAEKLGFLYHPKFKFYIHEHFLNPEEIKTLKAPNKDFSASYKRTINYNANNESSTFTSIVRNYYSKSNLIRKPLVENYSLASALKGLTFGVELETSSGGFMSENLLDTLGFVPLKDGSIGSYEYATVPYGCTFEFPFTLKPCKQEMIKDLRVFYYGLSTLSKTAKTNNKCSLHVHFGNTMKSKDFIIAFYLVCLAIQEEMFTFQPYYKHDAVKYLGLKKNYCKKLPSLFDKDFFKNFNKNFTNKEEYDELVNYYYNVIFQFVSNGEPLGPKYNRTSKVHPMGKKWERTERYNWVNIVNTIFNNEETIEFRLHSGTLNPQKTMNWILICAAIINYTQNNIREILKNKKEINLNNILQGYCTGFRAKKKTNPYGIFLYNYLNAYVNERKAFFNTLRKEEDFAGNKEYNNDKNYVFTFETPTGPVTDLVNI